MRGAFLTFLLIAVPAAAQQSSPPGPAQIQPAVPEVTPEARQVARELFASIGGVGQMSKVLDAMRGQIVQLMQRQGVGASAAASAVDDILLPEFKARIGELQGVMADLYAAHYSVEEMRELQTWYQTPLGQKMRSVAPQIAAEAFAVGNAWGERVAREAMAKHMDELRQRGVKL